MIRLKRMAGLTLLEVMIASALLTIIVLVLFSILSSSASTYAWGTVHADLNGQARDLLDRLTRELADSSVSTFAPSFPKDSSTLTFRRTTGYSAGKLTYGPPITYSFVFDPGEADNGIDDNRDGRVDEGRIVRAEGGQSVVLTRNAREGGLSFTQAFGNTVTIRVTLERLDENRKLMTHDRQTTVQVRN